MSGEILNRILHIHAGFPLFHAGMQRYWNEILPLIGLIPAIVGGAVNTLRVLAEDSPESDILLSEAH